MEVVTHYNILNIKETNSLQSTPKHKRSNSITLSEPKVYLERFPSDEAFEKILNVSKGSPPVILLITPPTPQRKQNVKRNLNVSFSETPDSNKINVLNYSIDKNTSLKLTLKRSKTQTKYTDYVENDENEDIVANLPKIVDSNRKPPRTRRLSFADDIEVTESATKKIAATRNSKTQHASYTESKNTPARKSDRPVQQKSYTDYTSLAKRMRSKSINNDGFDHDYEPESPRINSFVGSPKKRLRSKSVDIRIYNEDSDLSETPSEDEITTKKSARIAKYNKVSSESPKKRPRRSSVANKSYKEFDTDDCDTSKNDNSDISPNKSYSSPIKRSRSGRTVKTPSRYYDSPDEIVDGLEQLDMSDKEEVVELRSPRKIAKYSEAESLWRKNGLKMAKGIRREQGKFNVWSKSRVEKSKVDSDDEVKDAKETGKKSATKARSNGPTIIHNTPSITPPKPKSPKTPSRAQPSIRAHANTPSSRPLPKHTSKCAAPSSSSKVPRPLRLGALTPTVQSRATPVRGAQTPLDKARAHLHVAHVPDALPCREREAQDICGFVEGKLGDGCGGCMYISGVPGTGKTATVTYVIRQLKELSQNCEIPKFDFISVNGMKLTEPRQSYVEILKQLTGKTVPWEQAHNQLDAKFTKKGQKCKPIVLLIDELDILCTKRQDVVYNLLDWPSKAFCQLIVITIANTMDLPERLLIGRVTSRLGLTRLTFQAYNHKQLQEIVTKRLSDTKTFNPDAIQLVARKVASVSGDARRALDICRRAAEIAEAEGKNTLVSMTHVNDALDSMMTQPKIRAIKSSSRLQKLLLQSVVAEVERTGVEETTFAAVYKIFSSVAAIDGFDMAPMTVAMAAIGKLGCCRLLLLEQKLSGLYQKIMLNVSVDDVYYALRKD